MAVRGAWIDGETVSGTDLRLFELLDRIPGRYRKPIGSLMYAGEEREAVTNLAATVADDQVPVTADERDDLRRLLEYLKEPTDMLSRLNVVPEPPTA